MRTSKCADKRVVLRCRSALFLKFVAKMSVIRKCKFRNYRLIRPALAYQILGHSKSQISRPHTGGFSESRCKMSFQVTQRNLT